MTKRGITKIVTGTLHSWTTKEYHKMIANDRNEQKLFV